MEQERPQKQISFSPTHKQMQALAVLADDTTSELVFGGAAGGGKSYLGCAWCVLNAYQYPGSRGLLGRAILKQLKQSTLLTLFQVCQDFGLVKGVDYIYKEQDGLVLFPQYGSTIYLKDLFAYPSDPEFDSLGSTEYTYAFIDEASQIKVKAKNVVRSRLRFKLNEFQIIPKLLMTCNPSKNFLYTEFYKPSVDKTIDPTKAFIASKVQHNPYLPASYIESMKTLDKTSQERLLYGNWEYDDDPAALMDYDSIIDIFTNQIYTPEKDSMGKLKPDTRQRYISCDVARFGKDKTVIAVWYGLECVELRSYAKTSTTTVAGKLKEAMQKHKISASHVIIDEDGIGGGVKDQLYGAKGFIANTRPFRDENYQNLKAQCYYKLASLVNSGEIAVRTDNLEHRQLLIEELEQVKAKDIDKDGKQAIQPKQAVSELLGRSPDFSDTLMMRMYFEFKPKARLTFL